MQQDLFITPESLFTQNLLPYDGEVNVYPGFFDKSESDHYLQVLLNTIDWQQDKMKIYGKEVNLPRLTAWYGEHRNDYSYSGISMKSKLWTPELKAIKEKIEKFTGIKFTSVLLNYYRDGNDSVSWHRDNEKVLRTNPIIASVSFGATRIFKFRHVKNHDLTRSVTLENGTFLLMKGETQHMWEHSIPKSKKVSKPRISLTFRILY